MNTLRWFNYTAVIALSFLASGCAYNVGFKSSYLPEHSPSGKLDEMVLIFMTSEQEQWVYSGHPTSFTGGATTLTVPLGNITKQVTIIVFSRYFEQVDYADNMDQASQYRIVVTPNVNHFEYAYNQLKNLGFAITPQMELDLHVAWYDATGNELLDKTYSTGKTEGESYMMSGSPEEKLNHILHKSLAELMTQAAEETVKLVDSSQR